MTTYRAVDASEYDPDSPIKTELLAALVNNVLAIIEGDATAPKIQGAALNQTSSTWQNVSGSRSTGASYENTTGQDIEVMITAESTSGSFNTLVQWSNDDSTWLTLYSTEDGGTGAVSFSVGAGQFYRVTDDGAGAGFTKWLERRP